MKRTLLCGFLSLSTLFALQANAQLTETFDNFTTATTTNGWTFQNLSTPVGTATWQAGLAGGVFPGQANDFIAVNYNSVAGANTISNWLLSPQLTLANGGVITFYTRTVDAPAYADNLQVRMSTNGASTNVGGTNVSVGDFTTMLLEINPTLNTGTYPNTWTQYSITITGLAGPVSGRIALRYFVPNGGPSGANSDYIGIDQFVYNPPASPNLAVSNPVSDYTNIPLSQAAAMPLTAQVSNIGSASSPDATLSVRVFQAPNYTTPIYTASSAPTAIVNGNSSVLSAGTYTPTAVGTYRFQYISNGTGNTINASDTTTYDFDITNNEYARDNGVIVGTLGIGACSSTSPGTLGNKFTIYSDVTVDSVKVSFQPTSFGDSTRVYIYNVAGGVPTTLIGTTDSYTFQMSDVGSQVDHYFHATDMSGNPLILTSGEYLFASVEYDSVVPLGHTTSIFRNNTIYVNWATSPFAGWAAVEQFGSSAFNRPFMIRPFLTTVCYATFATDNQTACDSYTWIDGITYTSSNNTATHMLTNAAGCDSIITLNLTMQSNNGVDILSECSPFTWIDGNVYTSSNNTATHTLTNAAGCDSVVTLDLTILTNGSTDVQTACDSYTWIDGITYTSSNNTATFNLTNVDGCDSIITLDLTITASPSVSASADVNNVITATGGTTYQWIDCGSNTAIAGETNATFTPTQNGSYAVTSSNGSCSDTSNCVVISTISVAEYGMIDAAIYPNPTMDFVTIRFAEISNAGLIVRDLTGKEVASKTVNNNEVINMTNWSTGVYFFELFTETGSETIRIVKQ
jgi:hypothetical protein